MIRGGDRREDEIFRRKGRWNESKVDDRCSGGLRQAMLLPWRRAHCAKLIEFMKYGIRLRARAPPNWAARHISR